MANADFVASYYPFASRVASMTGIDPRLVLAQAALETGWGKSAPGQNYFGIKAPSGDTMPTLEYVNGRPVQTRAAFRSYESPEQSFEDYARLMASPRYERVRTSPTLEAQAEALQAAGYATDPDYAKKLVQIASGIPQTGARGVADRAMVELGRTRPAGGEVMDGLLGTRRMEDQPAQPMAQPEQRGLGATFSDPAFLENLALAFNTLRMTPDQNLATVIRGRQERRADTATRNRTIEFLRQRGREDLAAAVESGAIDAKTAAAQIFAQPERTAMQQNYEFLLQQGMTPEQALQAVRSGTTVNVGGESSEFRKASEKELATQIGGMASEGLSAQRNLGLINELDRVLQQAPQGFGGALVGMAGNLGLELGEGAGAVQAAQAIINRLVPQQRQPGSGPMSDADLALFKQSLPRIINQPEGNRRIIDTLKAIAQYDIDRGDIARRAQIGEITPYEALQQIQSLPNPLDWVRSMSTQAPTPEDRDAAVRTLLGE